MRVADESKGALGVYVSVPFCRAKCSFCNFASGVSSAEAVESYVGHLCAEITGAGERAQVLDVELPRGVDSVYFGGGTPSLLTAGQMVRIFAALRGEFELGSGAEITMEAAPGQIGGELLQAAMRMGVNRVSLGVQSFVDRESAAVGRLHTGAQCREEIARLRAAGLEEVGADLIAGLPYQTAESWAHSLEEAVGAGLTHMSVYTLEVDEGSRLGREVLGGGARLHAPAVASEELMADLYEMACERMVGAGFGQYEISNFARLEPGEDALRALPRHASRHNAKYWRREPYVGFGLDAHSMLRRGEDTRRPAVRFANRRDLAEYAAGAKGEVTWVDADAAFEEALFLGLRMNAGVAVEGLRAEFGDNRVEACEDAAGEMREAGWMEVEDGRWRLSGAGRLVSNEVFGRLLEGVGV